MQQINVHTIESYGIGDFEIFIHVYMQTCKPLLDPREQQCR
jgi:hypothetical protein